MATGKSAPGGNNSNLNYKVCSVGKHIYSDFEVDYDDTGIFEDPDTDDFCDMDEKEECPENFLQAVKRLKNRLVTVEFECDGCCKKATGILKCLGSDFVLLIRQPKKLVLIEMFCQNIKGPVIECACEVVIQFKKIIGVELVATQKCPPKR